MRIEVSGVLREPASGGPTLVAAFSRSSDMRLEGDWAAWYEGEQLPRLVCLKGVTSATHWEVAGREAYVSPPIGFTHATFIECAGDADDLEQLLQALTPSRDDSTGARLHSLMDVEVLTPAGRWLRPPPSSDSTGSVIAFCGPNDRLRQDEWDDWYDEVHIPDMMATGLYRGASRWIRAWARFGPSNFVIYDIAGVDVEEAMKKTRSAMAAAEEAGRILPIHAGGIRAWFHPAGGSTTCYRVDN